MKPSTLAVSPIYTHHQCIMVDLLLPVGLPCCPVKMNQNHISHVKFNKARFALFPVKAARQPLDLGAEIP